MRTICLLESVSRANGGIFEAECALQKELSLGQGVDVNVVGVEDQFTAMDAQRWQPLKANAVKTCAPASIGYSRDLFAALDPKADLLYAATLWKYPSWAALQWAERTGKPMMIAPHGSLDPWALSNAAWKKRIAALLFKNRQLRKASCIRALCQSEAEAIRACGLTNPIAVIPNGVTIPELSCSKSETGPNGCKATAGSANLRPEDKKKKSLLFLGRIHPKKGLPNALKAFSERLKAKGGRLKQECLWQFVISGWDQGGHEGELMKLCKELGLSIERRASSVECHRWEAEVVLLGAAFGKEKEYLLRTADAFLLPSLSEGLPMSVLEAWSYGLPVVMTPECNLPEGFIADASIRIESSEESIGKGLDLLFSMNDHDLNTMGARGRKLVKEHFNWQTIAAQMKGVYDWMLSARSAPDCIRLHYSGSTL